MDHRPCDYITPKNLTAAEVQAYIEQGWELRATLPQAGGLSYLFRREISEERYRELFEAEA